MANPNRPRVLKVTRVALQWEVETSAPSASLNYLAGGDPFDARIMFEAHTHPLAPPNDNEEPVDVFLQLSIPLRLRGITAHAPVRIHIHPHAIETPTYATDMDIPDVIQNRLPGQVVLFSMALREPLQVIVPGSAASPVRAQSRPSGIVLDAVRSLRRATRLSIYMAVERPWIAHLQALCTILRDGRSKPLPSYDNLGRLWGGAGGRRWDGDESTGSGSEAPDPSSPPRYDEIGPGPPMAPTSEAANTEGGNMKRRRSSSTSSNGEDGTAAPDMSRSQTKRPDLRSSPRRAESASALSVDQRLALLEGLAEMQAVQIRELRADNKVQKQRVHELMERLRGYKDELVAVRREAEEACAKVEEVELDICEVRDNLETMEDNVQYCLGLEDEIADVVAGNITESITAKVIEDVTEIISTRGLRARNISFQLRDDDDYDDE